MSSKEKHWNSYWNEYCLDRVRRATHLFSNNAAFSLLMRYYNDRMPEKLCILDLGCGDGSLTNLFAESLLSMGVGVTVVGCDLSSTALLNARSSTQSHRVTFLQVDANQLPFRDQTFHGVMSFGYASVASYHDSRIQRELFRTIKPGGWLIVDFRNILSLYFIFFRPLWIVKWLMRFFGFGKRQYHLSTLGVTGYFSRYGFKTHSMQFLLSFPPLPHLPPLILMGTERLVDRLHLRRLFGRIFLVLFLRWDE